VSELKPCPFCGGKAIFREREVRLHGDHYRTDNLIFCTGCGAQKSAGKELNVEIWNRRAPEAGQQILGWIGDDPAGHGGGFTQESRKAYSWRIKGFRVTPVCEYKPQSQVEPIRKFPLTKDLSEIRALIVSGNMSKEQSLWMVDEIAALRSNIAEPAEGQEQPQKLTIDQLEKILENEPDEALDILPNGEVRRLGKKLADEKPLTMRENLGGEYADEGQEPVAWMYDNPYSKIYPGDRTSIVYGSKRPDERTSWKPLYAQPQRPAVPEGWMESAKHIVHVYDQAKELNNEFGEKAAFASSIWLLREMLAAAPQPEEGKNAETN